MAHCISTAAAKKRHTKINTSKTTLCQRCENTLTHRLIVWLNNTQKSVNQASVSVTIKFHFENEEKLIFIFFFFYCTVDSMNQIDGTLRCATKKVNKRSNKPKSHRLFVPTYIENGKWIMSAYIEIVAVCAVFFSLLLFLCAINSHYLDKDRSFVAQMQRLVIMLNIQELTDVGNSR